MTQAPSSPAPLAHVRRGGHLECVHYGAVAVCDARGNVVFAQGDPQAPTFLRSSAKPFQAITSLRAGAAERCALTDEEVALMCASHGAQPLHLRVVANILRKCGLTGEALQCGPHSPMHEPSADDLLRAGAQAERIHNNCSGKHAGMLAACVARGWPTETYLRADHPLQVENVKTMAAFAGHQGDISLAVDGCGVPSFYLPLAECATAFARLASAGSRPAGMDAAADRVVRAMCQYPVHIAYEGQFGAVLIQHLGQHLVAKGGAEGVFCAGLIGRGLGIAVKTSDGSSRPHPVVMLQLLQRFLPSVDLSGLRAEVIKPVRNTRGEAVGDLCAAPD